MTGEISEHRTTPGEQGPALASWRRKHALGLPEGSVRALLAVAIFATIWVLLVQHPREEVPDYLRDLLFIVMGHYFASRRRGLAEPEPGPAPLYLPRGSIRFVLFAGFAAVAVLLYRSGHLLDPAHNAGVVTLLLVAGFLLGVLLARVGDWWKDRGHEIPRWIEDVKAIVAIVAALALIALVWNRFDPILIPRRPAVFDGVPLRFGRYGPEHLLGAVVGFYFGSRS